MSGTQEFILFFNCIVYATPLYKHLSLHVSTILKKIRSPVGNCFPGSYFLLFQIAKLLHVTHQPKCPNQFPKCYFKKAVKLLPIHNKLSWEQVKILQHQFLTIRQFAVPLGYVSCTALQPFQIPTLDFEVLPLVFRVYVETLSSYHFV